MIIDHIALFDQSATNAIPLIEVKSCTPALNFLCIPNEIKKNIIMQCNLQDLLNLKLVNKELNKIITDNMIITKFCQECEYYYPEAFNFKNYSDVLQKKIFDILPARYNKINDYITEVNNNNKQQFSDHLFSSLYKAMTNIKRIHLNKNNIKRYSFPEAISPSITKVLLSGCGNYLFTLVNNTKIIQWEFNLTKDFTQITEFYHDDDTPNIVLFAFQVDNNFITIIESGDLKIWYLFNAKIPTVKQNIPNLEHININQILSALILNNNWLFIRYDNNIVKVWVKNSSNNYRFFKNMTDIKNLSVSRDAKLLVILTTRGCLTFNIQNQTKNYWITTSTLNIEINNNIYSNIAINNKDGFCLLGDGYKNIIILQRVNDNYNWQLSRKIKLTTDAVYPFFLCYQNKFMVLQKHKYLTDDNIISLFSIEKNNTCLHPYDVSIKGGAKGYIDSQSTHAVPHPNGLAAACFIDNENKDIDIIFFNHDKTYYCRKIIQYISFIPAILILYFAFFYKV